MSFLNAGGFANFSNFPFLSGTYSYRPFDPLLNNPFLNPFMLAQSVADQQSRARQDALLGLAAFGATQNGNVVGSQPNAIDLLNQLVSLNNTPLLPAGSTTPPPPPPPPPAPAPAPATTESPDIFKNTIGAALQILLGNSMNSNLSGLGLSSGAQAGPTAINAPGAIPGDTSSVLNALLGQSPFNRPTVPGLFSNAQNMYPTFNFLATLDPTYQSGRWTSLNEPLYGALLATGRAPDFLMLELLKLQNKL